GTRSKTRRGESTMRDRIGHLSGQLAGQLALLWLLLLFVATHAVATVPAPASNRLDIDLGETPWLYKKDADSPDFSKPDFVEDSTWQKKGLPQSPSDDDTFINEKSGGGEGELTGNITWYRKHFKIDPSYANRKVLIEIQYSQTGAQV